MRRLAPLFVLPLTSCILLVSTPESADHCRFAGTDSLCGACVKSQCQGAVDRCCGDDQCRATLSDLETCTTKHDASCSALKQGTTALSACVAEHCRGSCEPLSGASQTHCEEPYLGQGTLCSCQYGPPLNDQICSSALYPDTLCCAPQSWPGAGQKCACQPIGCQPTTNGGCICTLVDYSFPDLQRVCEGTYCCAAEDNCACGETPCQSWKTQVEKCTLAALSCPANNKSVTTCSPR